MIEYHFNNEHQKFNRIVSGFFFFFGGGGGGGGVRFFLFLFFFFCFNYD